MSNKVQRTDCNQCVNRPICMFAQVHAGLGKAINDAVDGLSSNMGDLPWVEVILVQCKYASSEVNREMIQQVTPQPQAPQQPTIKLPTAQDILGPLNVQRP